MCLYTALPYTATLLHLHWFWSYSITNGILKGRASCYAECFPDWKASRAVWTVISSTLAFIAARKLTSDTKLWETLLWIQPCAENSYKEAARKQQELSWSGMNTKKPESIRWAAEIASLLMGNVRSHLVLTRVERIFVSRFCSVHVKDRITPRPLRTQICKTEITLIIPE